MVVKSYRVWLAKPVGFEHAAQAAEEIVTKAVLINPRNTHLLTSVPFHLGTEAIRWPGSSEPSMERRSVFTLARFYIPPPPQP